MLYNIFAVEFKSMKKSLVAIYTIIIASVIVFSSCVQGDGVRKTQGSMSDKQFADTSDSQYWQRKSNESATMAASDSTKMDDKSKEAKKESSKKSSKKDK